MVDGCNSAHHNDWTALGNTDANAIEGADFKNSMMI